jgi:hypothetical protein
LSESHSPAEETRASNTSIIRMEAWLFPSRRPPPLLNQGPSERTSAQTNGYFGSFVNTGATERSLTVTRSQQWPYDRTSPRS